jgi:radical SAM superfamily enzyme YgiQ (UPF0313 family)
MKIAYVSPRMPETLWSLGGMAPITGRRSTFAPLGLATAMALTPNHWLMEVYDEEIGPIDFDTDADLVALTAFNVQAHRAFEVACAFRERGKYVAFGGPYATICPDKVRPFADTLILGDCEYIWPEFLADFERGTARQTYHQQEFVDIKNSPCPAYERLDYSKYLMFTVQTSRGCPFLCEFCDIPVTAGRVPRTKSVAQVMKEIEKLHGLGVKYVTFSDANFIGNPKYTEQLLEELARFSESNGYPISFSCEATMNLVAHERILELMRRTNFEALLIGVESPRKSSLLETRKVQNTRRSISDAIRKVHSYNIMVITGMIVGFDNDDTDIFQEQFDFLMDIGTPFTTAGLLVAVELTPLYERLKREGRLLEYTFENQQAHGSSDVNFVPKLMTREQMIEGYNWLIRALYSYDNYRRRLIRALEAFEPARCDWRQVNTFMAHSIFKLLGHYLLTRDSARRRFFLRTLAQAITRRPTANKIVAALTFMALHAHFHEFVARVHGDPEDVPAESPFARTSTSPAPLTPSMAADD